MRFQTTDWAEGCWKVVASPARMLKLFQSSTALCEAWTIIWEPAWETLTEPPATVSPAGLACTRQPWAVVE
jgi:hypothetical protein